MPSKKKRSTKETVEAMKVEAILEDADGLTLKQSKFVQGYLELGNASEAYRRAYDTANMAEKCVWEEACKLLAHPKVSQRVTLLKQKAEDAAVLDRAWVLKRLMRNARIAMGEESVKLKMKLGDAAEPVEVETSDRNGAIANKALELLGKTPELAMFIDRKEIGDPGDYARLSDEEIRQQAAEIAERLNIPAKPPRTNGNGRTKH